jgi:mannose-6-phosphate isomerase
VPATSARPWAGTRLGDGIGERWLAGPDSRVRLPDGATTTLEALAADEGPALVGHHGLALLGRRFPLLAKLIDAAEWLSLQVHPTDALATALYGPAAVGKSEAWVVLAADPGTVLVTGPRRDLDAASVRAAIAGGTMDRGECDLRAALPGDLLHLPAGTLHAIGAGAFVYEVEQPSDLTFRISDWGRPPTAARPLHRDEALRAVDPSLHARASGSGFVPDGGALLDPHFRLEVVEPAGAGDRRPGGRTPEIVTAIGGGVVLEGDGWRETLAPLETAVVPAAIARYRLVPEAESRALVATVPARDARS